MPAAAAHVLIVEDSMPIALDTAEALEAAGLGPVAIAATEQHALRLLDEGAYRFAILDVTLERTTSIKIAQTLSMTKIPFVLTTGLAENSKQLKDFPEAMVLQKPYRTDRLIEIVAQALEAAQA